MSDRREEFHAIARHRKAGVPYLVSAWQHLVGHEYGAEAFAAATIDFVRRWDWDWVKINPRAIYYSEAWGSRYDPSDYDGFVIPRKISSAVASAEDLRKVVRLNPHENNQLSEQLEAAAIIRRGLADRAVLDTVFSPLSVLLQLADLPLYPGDTYAKPSVTRDGLVFDHPEDAKRALGNIADTLADYAAALVTPKDKGGAGLDGIFYAVTGTVSEDYFDASQYAEFGEPYDRIVLDAIAKANPDAEILLHTCRDHSHPDLFVDFGEQILQWDQYQQGNPQIDADFPTVPVGGPSSDDFAVNGSAETVSRDIRETVRRRQGSAFLLAPSCTVPTPASEESLTVLSQAKATN